MVPGLFSKKRVPIVLFILSFLLITHTIFAQTTPSPTPAGSVPPGSCTNGIGWVNQTISANQGKQLSGLPVPMYRSDTSFAYGPADQVYYSLGRAGSVVYKFPGEVINIAGPDINIYEITNGRSTYPLETARVDVSADGTTWFTLNILASSRFNTLGISNLDFSATGLAKMQYIRLTDINNPANLYLESDGFDLNAIQAVQEQCITPTPTITPSNTPTTTPSNTPTLTPTTTPTITPTPSLVPVPITIDFGTLIATGSPLIFGGANFPDHRHDDAWNKIADAGVTMIRRDLFPEFEVPQGITLQDYQNNVNDVRNVSNWTKINIDTTTAVLQQAKSRNMTTMAIMAYSPPWLNTCNCRFGVPIDFDVYKDIVKKVYTNHRTQIDYIEVWNEPTYPFFFDPTGSGMTREQAYVKMFKTASAAIREADTEANDGKRAVIGGMVASSPLEYPMLQAMATDSAVLSNLDFLSYHDYHQNVPFPSWSGYKNILQTAGLSHIPLYMTEWNYYFDDINPTPFNGGPESVSFTGKKFTQFLRMGLKIAQYHGLTQINTSRPNNGAGTYGFYRWDATTNTATLLDQSKTWRLLSKTLGLGAGQSNVYAATSGASIPSIGFINSVSKRGMVLVNESATNRHFQVRTISINPVPSGSLYQASQTSNGDATVLQTITPTLDGAVMVWNIIVPPLSVTGIILN